MRNQPSGEFTRDLPGWMESWRFLNGSRPFDERAAARYTQALYVGDPRNAQVAVNHVHAMSTVPETLAEDLTRVRCPVQVIHGTEDPLFFSEAAWHEILAAVIAHIET